MKCTARCISKVRQLMKRLFYLAVLALAVPAIFENSADATTIDLPSFIHNGQGAGGTDEVDVDVSFGTVEVVMYDVIVNLNLNYNSLQTWEVDIVPDEMTQQVDYMKGIGNNSGILWSKFRVTAIGASDIFSLGGTPVPIRQGNSLLYDLSVLGSTSTFLINYAVVPASPYSLHLTPIPVPEPTTALLALLGLLGISKRSRRE